MQKNLFSNKIKYLFNILELNQKDFTRLFWNNDPRTLQTRGKTVDNWLNKDIKRPKGFYFEEYNIAKKQIADGKSAFTKESFLYESFEEFKLHADEYLRYKAMPKEDFGYNYIYYYDSHLNKISFVRLEILKKIHSKKYSIQIILSKDYDENAENIYIGELLIDKNYYHISAKNDFEILSFYFILNLGFKNDDAIYGLRLGKAYGDGLPLSAKNLLTKNKLNQEEKKEVYLNLNELEEVKSSEAFDNIYSSSKNNYLKKFHDKISNLVKYNSKAREILEPTIKGDVYHNIMSKEFFSFSKISKNVESNNSFYIHNIRRASKVFLKSIASRAEPCYIISSLTDNLTIFNEHDTKSESSLRLNIELSKRGLKISRIFVFDYTFQITEYTRKSIEQMIESGITVRMVKKEEIESIVGTSYDFIYSKGKDIALYRNPKERFYLYYVTKNQNVIDSLEIDYKRIKAKSYKFNAFLKQKYQIKYSILDNLLGDFNHYGYGSEEGRNGESYLITNKKITFTHDGKAQYFENKELIASGDILIKEKQTNITLIDKSSQNIISISFDNTDIDAEIFRVIQIEKLYAENIDMISVGIFSREKLNSQTVKKIIGEEKKSLFKIPSDIKNNISEYRSKNIE